jgi:hypothetical protein
MSPCWNSDKAPSLEVANLTTHGVASDCCETALEAQLKQQLFSTFTLSHFPHVACQVYRC